MARANDSLYLWFPLPPGRAISLKSSLNFTEIQHVLLLKERPVALSGPEDHPAVSTQCQVVKNRRKLTLETPNMPPLPLDQDVFLPEEEYTKYCSLSPFSELLQIKKAELERAVHSASPSRPLTGDESKTTQHHATKKQSKQKEKSLSKDVKDACETNNTPDQIHPDADACKLGTAKIGDKISPKNSKHKADNVQSQSVQALPRPRPPYPRSSYLTRDEQKRYLELYDKLLHCGQQKPTTEEINLFKDLQTKVSNEQKEFMQFLEDTAYKNAEDYSFLHPSALKYTQEAIEHRQKRVINYPRYYIHQDSISLVPGPVNHDVVMTSIRPLLQLGSVPKTIVPNMNHITKPKLAGSYTRLTKRFPASGYKKTNRAHYNSQDCSRDRNTEKLAIRHSLDLVISSSGLSCLIDNHSPSYSRQWEMPIVVKEYTVNENGEVKIHKVVYVDKPFIAKSLSPRERNTWYNKFALRTLLTHPNHLNVHNFASKHQTEKSNSPEQQVPCTQNSDTFSAAQDDDMFATESSDVTELETFGSSSLIISKGVSGQESALKRSVTEKDTITDINSLFKTAPKNEASDLLCQFGKGDALNRNAPLAVKSDISVGSKDEMKETNGPLSDTVQNNADDRCELRMSTRNVKSANKSPAENINIDCNGEGDKESLSEERLIVEPCVQRLSKENESVTSKKTEQVSANKDEREARSQVDESRSQVDESRLQVDESRSQVDESRSQVDESRSQIDDSSDSETDLVIDVDLKSLSLPSPKGMTVIESPPQSPRNRQEFNQLQISPIKSPDYRSFGESSDGEYQVPIIPTSPLNSGDDNEAVFDYASGGMCPTSAAVGNFDPKSHESLSDPKSHEPPSEPVFGEPHLPSDVKSSTTTIKKESSDRADTVLREQQTSLRRSTRLRGKSERLRVAKPSVSMVTGDSADTGAKHHQKDDGNPGTSGADNGSLVQAAECSLKRRSLPGRLDAASEPPVKRLTRSRSISKVPEVEQVLPQPVKRGRGRPRKVKGDASELVSDSERTDTTLASCDQIQQATISEHLHPQVENGYAVNESDLSINTSNNHHQSSLRVKTEDANAASNQTDSLDTFTSDIGYTDLHVDEQLVNASYHNSAYSKRRGRKHTTKDLPASVSTFDQILQMQEKMLKTPASSAERSKEEDGHVKMAEGGMQAAEQTPTQNAPTSTPQAIPAPGGTPWLCSEDPKDYLTPMRENVVYSEWKFGQMKMLIRCGIHGVRQDHKDKQAHFVEVRPKLEYQSTYGYEQTTISETSRAWIASYIRNNCNILRARVNAFTSDVLMVEDLDQTAILYPRCPFNPAASMSVVYSVLDRVAKLPVGNYLLSHTVGNTHCHLKKNTNHKGGVYDLHMSYSLSEAKCSPIQWIPIDVNLKLPYHDKYSRIPATFEPRNPQQHLYQKKRKKGKGKKKKPGKASGLSSFEKELQLRLQQQKS